MFSATAGSMRLGVPTKLSLYVPMLALLCINLTGCSVVKGIFKAGVWVGVLGVFAVVALVVYGFSKLGRRT